MFGSSFLLLNPRRSPHHDSMLIIACCWLFPTRCSRLTFRYFEFSPLPVDRAPSLVIFRVRCVLLTSCYLLSLTPDLCRSLSSACRSQSHTSWCWQPASDPDTLFRAARSSLLDGYYHLITDHFSLLCFCCSLFSNCCPVLVPCIIPVNRSLLSFAAIYLMLAVVSCEWPFVHLHF